MEKINSWVTHKKTFVFGLIGMLGVSILFQRSVGYFLYDSCKNWNLAWSDVCMDTINYFGLLLLVGATVLIPSIIMFFVEKRVFEIWKKTLFIVIVIPWHARDAYLRIQKDIIASIAYVVFSLVYIFYKKQPTKI